MIGPLTHANTHRLMEEDGIGYYFADSRDEHAASFDDASKNEVSIESLESLVARHDPVADAR
jgi:hypothetical protein